MRKTDISRKGPAFLAIAAIIMICSGCPRHSEGHSPSDGKSFAKDYDPHYPHNLARVKCRKFTDHKDIKIEVVANAQVLSDLFDYTVFVCKDEKVYWHSTDKNVSITVNFKDPNKSRVLFATGDTTLQSSTSSSGSETFHEVVNTLERRAHEYTITVTGKDGVPHTLDPHVIPMGN